MRIQHLIFVLALLAFGCKSDSNSSNDSVVDTAPVDISELEASMESVSDEEVEVVKEMDEVIDQNALAKKMIVESKKEEVDEVAKVEDKVDVKLKGKSEEQKKKEAQLKLESTKEIIDSSLNKGKSCEQILEEQTKFVDEFEKSGDKKIILEMAKKQNDPFFKECLSQETFQAEIDKLDTRLGEIMDKM